MVSIKDPNHFGFTSNKSPDDIHWYTMQKYVPLQMNGYPCFSDDVANDLFWVGVSIILNSDECRKIINNIGLKQYQKIPFIERPLLFKVTITDADDLGMDTVFQDLPSALSLFNAIVMGLTSQELLEMGLEWW